jgi:hypothetical protein
MVLQWQAAGNNRGPQGVPGSAGATGATGPPGATGDTGPQGATGVTTLAGATDYDGTGLADGKALIWVAASSKFKPGGPFAPVDNPTFTTKIRSPIVQMTRANTTDVVQEIWVGADAGDRFQQFADGYMKWGDGTNATDLFLYRNAAGVLRTNGKIIADGLFDPASMPRVMNPIRSGTVSASLTSDASTTAGNLVNLDITGAATINPPTNPTDFQQLRYHCVAVGAARTVTFGAGILTTTGITLGPYSLTRGQVLAALLEYVGNKNSATDVDAPAWALMSATIVG